MFVLLLKSVLLRKFRPTSLVIPLPNILNQRLSLTRKYLKEQNPGDSIPHTLLYAHMYFYLFIVITIYSSVYFLTHLFFFPVAQSNYPSGFQVYQISLPIISFPCPHNLPFEFGYQHSVISMQKDEIKRISASASGSGGMVTVLVSPGACCPAFGFIPGT